MWCVLTRKGGSYQKGIGTKSYILAAAPKTQRTVRKRKKGKNKFRAYSIAKGLYKNTELVFFSSSSFAAFRPVEEKETCSSSFGGRTSKDIHILSARMQRFADFGLGIDRAQCSLYTHQQEESVTLKDSADY